MKTYTAKLADIEHKWSVIDANGSSQSFDYGKDEFVDAGGELELTDEQWREVDRVAMETMQEKGETEHE